MTPGAGTAHVVGRVACRRMRAGRWLNVVSRRSSGRHGWRPYVCGRLNAVSRRLSGRHKWRPYVCGWLIVVSRWSVCGVARGGAIYDARCRNGTCGRPRCVSTDAGGAMVECCFAAVIRASRVAPLRLRAVECCFASVIRASQVAPLRLRVVDCCFAGGCWRRNEGLSEDGDGYEKRSRTDVAVSVWLLVVAEARLERTTSRL